MPMVGSLAAVCSRRNRRTVSFQQRPMALDFLSIQSFYLPLRDKRLVKFVDNR